MTDINQNGHDVVPESDEVKTQRSLDQQLLFIYGVIDSDEELTSLGRDVARVVMAQAVVEELLGRTKAESISELESWLFERLRDLRIVPDLRGRM